MDAHIAQQLLLGHHIFAASALEIVTHAFPVSEETVVAWRIYGTLPTMLWERIPVMSDCLTLPRYKGGT